MSGKLSERIEDPWHAQIAATVEDTARRARDLSGDFDAQLLRMKWRVERGDTGNLIGDLAICIGIARDQRQKVAALEGAVAGLEAVIETELPDAVDLQAALTIANHELALVKADRDRYVQDHAKLGDLLDRTRAEGRVEMATQTRAFHEEFIKERLGATWALALRRGFRALLKGAD